MRHVCEEDDFYLEKDCPFKIDRSQGYINEEFVVTSDHIKFKGKFLHVLYRVRKELYIPSIETLLWRITRKSTIINKRMGLMCQPTLVPY